METLMAKDGARYTEAEFRERDGPGRSSAGDVWPPVDADLLAAAGARPGAHTYCPQCGCRDILAGAHPGWCLVPIALQDALELYGIDYPPKEPQERRHTSSPVQGYERCAYCGWSRGTHQAGCPNEEPPWRATGSCKPCSYCGRSDGTHSPICEHWSSPARAKTSHTPPTLAGLQRRLDEQTLFNRKVDNCIEQMLMLQQRLKDQTQRQDDLLAKLQLDVVNLQSSPCIPVHKRGVTATGTVSLGRACQQMCELPRKAFERISVVSRLSARRS